MMKIIFCFLLLNVISVFAQENSVLEGVTGKGGLKVALVDIQSLFQSYRKTISAEREIVMARAEIQKKSQLASNQILSRKSLFEKKAAELAESDASEAEVAEFRREAPFVVRELELAEKDRQKRQGNEHEKLNTQMVRRMDGILREIVKLTAKKAEEEGFDLVIDTSGVNSNQVLPILFTKNSTDITEIMRKNLSK